METFKDYYRTLRVRPTADDVTIKAASGGSGRDLFMTPKRMPPGRIVDLLHRIGCLRQPCDLDLFYFGTVRSTSSSNGCFSP